MIRALRRLLGRRRPAPAPRPSQIAVLEHDIYGTPVAPNSTANLAIGLRALGNAGTSTAR